MLTLRQIDVIRAIMVTAPWRRGPAVKRFIARHQPGHEAEASVAVKLFSRRGGF